MSGWGRNPRVFLMANAVSLVMALARNVVLARLIGPEQFGIAATFLLLVLFFDAVSDAGADRYLIQAPEGARDDVLHNAQLLALFRGAAQAGLIVAFAIPISRFFNTPGAAGAYMLLAVVPLLVSLANLDCRRAQRGGNFGPEIAMTTSAELVCLVVTVVGAFALRDYHAALYGLIARAFTLFLVSQLTAGRRLGFAFDPAIFRRIIRFGWPLMLSATVIFFALQGDRAMVSALIGPRELGIYSAAVMITYAPVNVLYTTFVRFGLARLSRLQDDLVAFDREYSRFSSAVIAGTLVSGIGFAVFGAIVSELLFGKAYGESAPLFFVLGALQSTRLLRVWPNSGSFALGRTTHLLLANACRLLALPLGYALFLIDRSIVSLAAGFFLGEMIALVWALVQYNRARGKGLLQGSSVIAMFLLTLCAVSFALPYVDRPAGAIVAFVVLSIVALAIAIGMKRGFVKDLMEIWTKSMFRKRPA